MKYIIACLFSLGVMTGAFAQGDTTQQQQEGMITCMYLDENTIACFSPTEYDMEGQQQEEGFHYGQPNDSLFDDQAQGDEMLRNEEEIILEEGAPNENQPSDTRTNEGLIETEPKDKINGDEEVLDDAGTTNDPQGKLNEEQDDNGSPTSENPK